MMGTHCLALQTVAMAVLLSSVTGLESGNLLQNADFENSFEGNWFCKNCILTQSSDANSGIYSGNVTTTSDSSEAQLSQYVNVQPGKTYYVKAALKCGNGIEGHMWHVANAMLHVTYTDGSAAEYFWFGRIPNFEPNVGWQILGGDLTLSTKGIDKARLYFKVNQTKIDFFVDSVSLVEVIQDPNWQTTANERIEANRKSNVTFQFNVNITYDPSKVEVTINLTRHKFLFGSAVKSYWMYKTVEPYLSYQKFFYENFEVATLETALKWKNTEKTQGQTTYRNAEKAIDALEKKGFQVRGHTVHWSKEGSQPDWVKTLGKDALLTAMNNRTQSVVSNFNGRLFHWDVYNERLHEAFFEERTRDPSILEKIFRKVHEIDPKPKLFLNEYGIINYGAFSGIYPWMAKHLNSTGAPLYGLGIQGHMKGRPNIDIVAKRLEVAASGGFPIWITELDVDEPNITERANGYEDLLRLFYSLPCVEGVVLWGFWEYKHPRPNCALVDSALVDGETTLVPNEAGERYQYLTRQEWSTNERFSPSSANDVIKIRAFQGKYNLIISYDGQIVKTETFDVPQTDVVVDVIL